MVKRNLVAAGAALFFGLHAFPGLAQQTPFVGEIMIIATNFCPVDWAAMDGQLLPISEYTALFSLLGTNYGGDGKTTFGLPLAKPLYTATGVPLTQCISLAGVFPPRE